MLLLISDLDVSHDEITILSLIYDMMVRHDPQFQVHTKDASYEIVWLPMVDRLKVWRTDKFSGLSALMPWYYVDNPQKIDRPVVKYIREKLNFEKKMITVSLDPMGKITSTNSTHMIWIWQNVAFPFSRDREEALWNTESWTLKLLADGIGEILTWVLFFLCSTSNLHQKILNSLLCIAYYLPRKSMPNSELIVQFTSFNPMQNSDNKRKLSDKKSLPNSYYLMTIAYYLTKNLFLPISFHSILCKIVLTKKYYLTKIIVAHFIRLGRGNTYACMEVTALSGSENSPTKPEM